MSIIVDFTYDYWGDNGRYHESKLDEYDDERQAISELGYKAHYHAIDGTVQVLRVLGGDEGAAARIYAGVQLHVAREVRRERIYKLKQSIAENEKWFANLEAETERRSGYLEDYRKELSELEFEASEDSK